MRAILFGALGIVTLARANPVPWSRDPSDPYLPLPRPTRPLEWGDVNVLHTTDIHGWISGHSKQVYPEKSWSGDFGDFYSFVTHMREIAKQRDSDLLLVDTGDRRIGHGLTDGILDPKGVGGRRVSLLYRDIGYDLVVPGNHDLESPKLVKWTMDTLVHLWGGRYITSNINRANGDALGARYRQWKSPMGKQMMAFGVVPIKTKTPKDLKVIPINDMVNQEWFKNATKRQQDPNLEVDAFVLLGHVDPQTDDPADDIKLIYKAIRREHPLTPIMIFAGHTHKRWCRTLQGEDGENGPTRSMLIQSGRYFDTVGWMSVRLDNNTASFDLEFSRRFLDNNVQTYMYHTGIESPTEFHTKTGKLMSDFVQDMGKSGELSQVYGNLKLDYFLDRQPWTEREKDKHSLFTFYLDAVQHSLVNPAKSKNWLFFSNWGIVRSDIYRGPFALSDLYAISPNASDDSPFLYTTVPRRIADQIIKKTQELDKAKGDPKKIPKPEPETIQAVRDDSQSHFSLPPRNPEGLTYGWVTKDRCGNDGDDVRHFEIPKVSFEQPGALPTYFWRRRYISRLDPDQDVDIIVTNRIGRNLVPKALQLLQVDCGDCELKPYREDVKQDNLLTEYIQTKFPSKPLAGKNHAI
ncbi:unnamed protein product [Rhizoctonia solani]|uniref:Calcineurin-like phosphoesterase domain-containing protein n=1 Tax=Rhizoctonia solani TaxID=456999 RepID=A0A8H3HRP2_9AGAM|nr:unnamed protein product [Rhizoctonia solani]